MLSTALSSATQHAMPPEFGRKWGTECLNTRFPLPNQLYAGYSVKLIFIYVSKVLQGTHENEIDKTIKYKPKVNRRLKGFLD